MSIGGANTENPGNQNFGLEPSLRELESIRYSLIDMFRADQQTMPLTLVIENTESSDETAVWQRPLLPIAIAQPKENFASNRETVVLKPRIPLRIIVDAVSEEYEYSAEELHSKSRIRSLVEARHVAMFLARELGSASFKSIAAYFDDKDHTGVKYGIGKIQNVINDPQDQVLRDTVEMLRTKVTADARFTKPGGSLIVLSSDGLLCAPFVYLGNCTKLLGLEEQTGLDLTKAWSELDLYRNYSLAAYNLLISRRQQSKNASKTEDVG